jgi:hypothetical protein
MRTTASPIRRMGTSAGMAGRESSRPELRTVSAELRTLIKRGLLGWGLFLWSRPALTAVVVDVIRTVMPAREEVETNPELIGVALQFWTRSGTVLDCSPTFHVRQQRS